MPALLRRVADSLDERGAVEVHDLILHAELTEHGDWPSVTVYFTPEQGPDLNVVR